MPYKNQEAGMLTTLAGPARHETEIKKSRFIANALRIETSEDAMEHIRETSLPDATHNCWAYKIGEQYRFSDDGEPGGSAGRPILSAIENQELDQVMVVVTRYFGGRKLGVGGLVRAYGGTAAECLRLAAKLEIKPLCRVKVEIPFPDVSRVYNLLAEFNVRKAGESFFESGVILELELEKKPWNQFRQCLEDVTKGKMQVVDIQDL
ncbi:MAG: YigZ family protein [Acidobacteriota bacterium]